jgi:RNA polymerase sigma-70 factor, ECF subfamily
MQASVAELEDHRAVLTGHCYRMLGSPADADDAVQETMIRAWKSLDRFDGRSSLRTWLYRISTNVCLDALADRSRRSRPMEEGPAGTVHDELTSRERTHWLEPIPDGTVLRGVEDPAARTMMKQSIRLAFVAALQNLPPRQRAVLLMVEVLGCSPGETAECLEMSVAAVNSALQRARATVGARNSGHTEPLSAVQKQLLERYVEAFERYDVTALTALLREDVKFCMPPYSMWLCGPDSVRDWMLGRGCGCLGSRLLPAGDASGCPAFGQYRVNPEGGYEAWGLIVLELDGDRIAGVSTFLDVEAMFPRFGLQMSLQADPRETRLRP